MELIKSFTIDHDTHEIGLYLSSTQEVGGHIIYTYDLRFCKPNSNNYLSNAVIHSIEHIIAVIIRNSEHKDKIVYFGPMGCRTGFYMLLIDTNKDEAKKLLKSCVSKIREMTIVPGAEKKQCGNYLEHDLDGAKMALEKYLSTL